VDALDELDGHAWAVVNHGDPLDEVAVHVEPDLDFGCGCRLPVVTSR
jgi:hypothetical protein